jgi:hypothetical protein
LAIAAASGCRTIQSTDGRSVHPIGASDLGLRLAFTKPLNGLTALVWVELRWSAKLNPTGLRTLAALTRPGPYQLTLELGQAAQVVSAQASADIEQIAGRPRQAVHASQ